MAPTKVVAPHAGSPLFGSYLVRRAHWLERKLATADYPGRTWDAGEYADLLAVFGRLGLEFDAVGSAPIIPKREEHEPYPSDFLEEPPRRTHERVPGPPRGSRYMKD